MNILKTKTTWSNLELGILKICAGSFYMMIGIHFYAYLKNYLFIIGGLFIITVTYLLLIWAKKEKIRT